MLPGRPVAMMLFKSWGYMLMANGLNFISDMKVGHYVRIFRFPMLPANNRN